MASQQLLLHVIDIIDDAWVYVPKTYGPILDAPFVQEPVLIPLVEQPVAK
jgi:hypothetical protein